MRSLAIMVLAGLALILLTPAASPAQAPAEPDPATPIRHVLTLMQENHSFDNYFGTYPGANGPPADTCMPIDVRRPEDGCEPPFYLGDQAIVDLGHGIDTFEAQYRDGAMDGFVDAFASQGDAAELVMGYYDDRDLPFYYNVADNYVLFDNFFTSAIGGSVWNHFFWVAGAPGNPERSSLRPEGFDEVTTIFDRLDEAGISWKFYVQNYDPQITFRSPGQGDRGSQIIWVPILNMDRFIDDEERFSRIVPMEEYFEDLQAGTLPAVAYMVPSGASEHPPGSIQAGERFVRTLITALMRSDAWDSSAFIWTYDDWGGWYDHVEPPRVDEYGYGFRAPALLVSPYAHEGQVNSTLLDFTSIIRFITDNWDLEPLAERDANANSLISAFDFASPPRQPVLMGRERDVVPVEVPDPRAVYLPYGLATVLPIGLIVLALARQRLARR